MAPLRNRARTPETLTNEQLAQNLHQLTQITQALSDNLLHNNTRPPPNENHDVARHVSNHRPPTFAGEEDPTILEEWIRTFNKISEVVGCPGERRVELATFYFGHEADLWWVHEGLDLRQELGFNWGTLKARLREHFHPAHVRAAMYEEFLHLKEGIATVVEYHKRFLELTRFAHVLVPTEATKVEKFVAGLNFKAKKALTVSKPRTLNKAYASAADLYWVQLLQRGVQEQAKRRNYGSGGPNFKKTRSDPNVKTTHT
ncbi:PREDICTED: uncharacterized protein LOC109163325 [Ipomoea nil]|uniref:uncharacterized protein LOC109163325 n=1 Tax=Ipomoea nil TaxID=35883 RepID=UPI0009019B97|nr:PREDICTED: uncharacterized protein LOC109163325 [Ipomoea nil]